MLGVMIIGRILSILAIVALTLGTAVQAGGMAGCIESAPAMGMSMSAAVDSQPDVERHCDDNGKAMSHTAAACHGTLCMAPLMPVETAQLYVPGITFAPLQRGAEWHDTAFSPDPHPPKPTSHI